MDEEGQVTCGWLEAGRSTNSYAVLTTNTSAVPCKMLVKCSAQMEDTLEMQFNARFPDRQAADQYQATQKA